MPLIRAYMYVLVVGVITTFLITLLFSSHESFNLQFPNDNVPVLRTQQQTTTTEESILQPFDNQKRKGVFVLGMHRSGTSLITGLLAMSCGYIVGKPLLPGKEDNEKGFFERRDIIYQNQQFLQKQDITWDEAIGTNPISNYSDSYSLSHLNLTHIKYSYVRFNFGSRALPFINMNLTAMLNNPYYKCNLTNLTNYTVDNPTITTYDILTTSPTTKTITRIPISPYIIKDPRLCITLQTWLALMTNEPAILHIYRNPIEVTMSLYKRKDIQQMEHGLKLWVIYNQLAIQNSNRNKLCIVTLHHPQLFVSPLEEIQRIVHELTYKCNLDLPLIYPPNRSEINNFIDINLRHNKDNATKTTTTSTTIMGGTGNEYVHYHDCIIYDYNNRTNSYFNSSNNDRTNQWEQFMIGSPKEKERFYQAMKIYCDLKNGKAYEDNYVWPLLGN